MILKLSEAELLEYRLRKTTLDYSRNQYMMVEESFTEWTNGMARALGIEGKYNIDLETGEIRQSG